MLQEAASSFVVFQPQLVLSTPHLLIHRVSSNRSFSEIGRIPFMDSFVTHRAWGFLIRVILKIRPDRLIPLMHLPASCSYKPSKATAAVQELCRFQSMAQSFLWGLHGATWSHQKQMSTTALSDLCSFPLLSAFFPKAVLQSAVDWPRMWVWLAEGNHKREWEKEK